ncbi:uncharacterized protein DEA37_0002602 [Paragonimus westermani]|uniref:Endonuclease/exonuclease/phosphatase domain-containing protein n=1 Tax=Paragonimus westermani TaxID=34504 RepID=A0A5J4P2A2_9TREM|nr:uncharacterized protein DEA37_0002602 [Paragonimus westermani]
MPQHSQLTSEPRVDASQPNLRCEDPSDPLRYSLQQCSQAQLELLLQLDCVKFWHEYLASAKLGCLLPLDLPDACNVSTGGRLRLASWNLNRFTLAKARHPGFREIVCLTILRANIALLVLQEVASLDVADVVRSSRIILVSVHLKATGLRNSMIDRTVAEAKHLETLVQAFYDTQPAFDGLRQRGFQSVLDGTQPTTVSTATSNAVPASPTMNCLPSSCQTAYDNVWLSPGLTRGDNPSHLVDAFYTGSGGVITEGLRHPLIPDDTGAGANGFISDHCPIWFDLQIL